MSLNYDLKKVENYQELYNEDKTMNQLYQVIILSTMNVGIREITKDNYKKFYNRLNVIERICGAFFFDSESNNTLYIQEEDVKRLIGLKTNASNKTKAEFFSTIKRMLPTEL